MVLYLGGHVIFEEVTKRSDKCKVIFVFMDFSKSYDKVPHVRLLRKVKLHGIQGKLAKWIDNWIVKVSRG